MFIIMTVIVIVIVIDILVYVCLAGRQGAELRGAGARAAAAPSPPRTTLRCIIQYMYTYMYR